MQALIDRGAGLLVRCPASRAVGWSRWSALIAGAVMLYDTATLFIGILNGAIVAVPFVPAIEVTPVTSALSLGMWTFGLVAFTVPRARGDFGWLAPLGIAMAALLDRQTFASSVLYLLVVAFGAHWWSERLRDHSYPCLYGLPLRILQTQVSVIFLWTSIAKLNPRFMSGALLSVSFSGPVNPPAQLMQYENLRLLAAATVVFEASLALSLWVDWLRKWSLLAAIVFHVVIVLFFSPTVALVGFAFAMSAGYALFAGEPWSNPAGVGPSRATGP